jgi:hypothetical protein
VQETIKGSRAPWQPCETWRETASPHPIVCSSDTALRASAQKLHLLRGQLASRRTALSRCDCTPPLTLTFRTWKDLILARAGGSSRHAGISLHLGLVPFWQSGRRQDGDDGAGVVKRLKRDEKRCQGWKFVVLVVEKTCLACAGVMLVRYESRSSREWRRDRIRIQIVDILQ